MVMYRVVVAIGMAAVLASTTPAAAQLPGQTDATPLRVATGVYDALARQFRDGRPAPEFRLAGPRAGPARVTFDGGPVIELGSRAYDVARSLGPDSLNALAYILAHELAHFYQDHDRRDGSRWFAGLSSAETRPLTSADKVRLEMEADLMAGFYAYLAGFRPLAVAPRMMSEIYRVYELDPAAVTTHPPLADRKVIAERVDSALTNLIEVFEGGVRLLVIGRYAEASRIFDEVARTFPSREVLSNAGVARSLLALEVLGDDVLYSYPFELDAESRLHRGERSMRYSEDQRREWAARLLREARGLFEAAITRDPDYATSYVNLAATYDLSGDHDVALAIAGLAARIAEAQGERATLAHAQVMRGIVLARTGDQSGALAELGRARVGAAALASANADVVRTGGPAGIRLTRQESPVTGRETIGGIGTTRDDERRMQNSNLMMTLAAVDRNRPDVGIMAKRVEGVPALLIGDMSNIVFMVSTPPDYRGESARGIRVGSSARDVEAAYGPPARIVPARQGAYHVYEMSRLAFSVDPAGLVTGWMIYTH